MAKDSPLYRHAVSELRLKGLLGLAEPLPSSLSYVALTVVDLFDDQLPGKRPSPAQSRFIINLLQRLPLSSVVADLNEYGFDIVSRLLERLPLSPLTGADDEWITQVGVLRNRRCLRVVRTPEGLSYDLGVDPTQCCPIIFPYLPPRET